MSRGVLSYRSYSKWERAGQIVLVGLVLPLVLALGTKIALAIVGAREGLPRVGAVSYWTAYWGWSVGLLTIGLTVSIYVSVRRGLGI